MSDDRFFARWSRLKRQATGAAPMVPAATANPAVPGTAAAAHAAAPPEGKLQALTEAIEGLSVDSDFSAYLQAEVGEGLRRQALKKLFADPHFNVMDGLDTYIADYSIGDPIPEEMLAGLQQMKSLFGEPAAPVEESAAGSPAPVDAAPQQWIIPLQAGQIAPEADKTSDGVTDKS